MFSTMTMASSTTRPTDKTIASSVNRLIVNPKVSIIMNADLHAGRQLRPDVGQRRANGLHDVECVRGRQREDADEHRCLTVEGDFLFVRFGAENDVGDVAEANDRTVLLLHH